MLQYETSEPVSNFFDTLSSNFLSPLILLPTRISNFCSTLIDDIFCNITFNSNISYQAILHQQSLIIYLCNIDLLLEKHAPLKPLNKQELKFQQEPWITQGLQIPIKKKEYSFFQIIRCKEGSHKKDLHLKDKSYRNLLSTLLKDSKQQYFTGFFKSNKNDIKKTCYILIYYIYEK